MKLTFINFFTHLIFHPEKANKKDYHKSLCASIALGIITLGALHLLVGIGWMAKRTYVSMAGQSPKNQEKMNGVRKKILEANSSKPESKPSPTQRAPTSPTATLLPTAQAAATFPAPASQRVLRSLPTTPIKWEQDFVHVDILNQKGYQIGGKIVRLREPVAAQCIRRDLSLSIQSQIALLKGQIHEFRAKAPKIQIKDATTDHAIYQGNREGNQHKIALNFANEHHAGGFPGIYRDPKSNQITQAYKRSAVAQEEALVNKSDLFCSLTLLPNEVCNSQNRYANGGFDSRQTAYISDNQLFGIQADGFYTTQFLQTPCDVSFVTSAAFNHNNKTVALDHESDAYKEAKARIQTHLYASAIKAIEMRKKDPQKPIELILGAFGCGMFAPLNAQAYASMIARIYQEELPSFNGFFDEITFAIPKMGRSDPADPSVRNFNAFHTFFGS